MRLLVTSDLHLTDRPKDAYRFGLFRQLAEWQIKYKPYAIVFLGDMTDAKDKHSAALVNRTITELCGLEGPVVILKGNHDYIDDKNPFFGFLNAFGGAQFLTKPWTLWNCHFVPHFSNEDEFGKACATLDQPAKYAFFHQCFTGAVSESGAQLSGFSTSPIEKMNLTYGAYAGDIHKPQKVGPVTYLGAPYTVRFGDNYEPRCLLLEEGKETNLYFDCPRKWSLTVRGPEDISRNENLLKGDQIKLVVEMAKEEAVEWQSVRGKVLEACTKQGLEVFGVSLKVNSYAPKERDRIAEAKKAVTAEDVLGAYCRVENIPSAVRQAGMELL